MTRVLVDRVCEIMSGEVQRIFNYYYKLTGGLPLDYAPESYLQVNFATDLKNGDVFDSVTLETTGRQINGWIGKNQQDVSGLGGQRIDIVGWTRGNEPVALIELKRAWGNIEIDNDAAKLRKWLDIFRPLGSKYGVIAVYTSAQKEETIVNRFSLLADNAGVERRGEPVIFPNPEEGYYHYHQGFQCFIVQ